MKQITTNKISVKSLLSKEDKKNRFKEDIKRGLNKIQKAIPSVYFYNQAGSKLFEEICKLDEYYQTRTEADILRENSELLAKSLPYNIEIIELGSGSSEKTKILLEVFSKKNKSLIYHPIDVSETFLKKSAISLKATYPSLNINTIAARYEQGLKYALNRNDKTPKLIIWLGSSIGNLNRKQSIEFLSYISTICSKNDYLLIGMDLKKDKTILENAYNDSKGITANFNINLLKRINLELGGEFNINKFKHRAIYNEKKGRIEMHLVSKENQNVYIQSLDSIYKFKKNEYIHTENSYKYNNIDIEELANKSEFRLKNQWLDKNKFFSINELTKK